MAKGARSQNLCAPIYFTYMNYFNRMQNKQCKVQILSYTILMYHSISYHNTWIFIDNGGKFICQSFKTSSLDKINICRICFFNSTIEQLGSISFRMKFEIVAPQQKNIFVLELCCGNLYKDDVIKISSYSRHGYLTLYRKNHQTMKYIIGMFIHEQCYIVVVKTYNGQNVLLYVSLMHTGSRWNISYITNHFVL